MIYFSKFSQIKTQIMKTFGLILMVAILALTGCKKCKHEDPRARIINQGTQSVSVQIMTSGGNTVNINNIGPGTTSAYASYASGSVSFNISIGNGNNTVNKSITVGMETCYEYDILIDANNNLSSVPTDRNKK